ncbi:uncharacterized protein LOC129585185 [Paramacrobiotus metropolitanus]|uniref:uncharacterized protein LOC129585185 n=1 Tax=Paramacrobiotus metropolitanus TaxID=2943436 RepID=UPI0024465D7F|nr:uncharacterized protein LOC129585185 [Paramacrobiotus metropolitanus]
MEQSDANADQSSTSVRNGLEANSFSLIVWAGITVALQIFHYFSSWAGLTWYLPVDVANSDSSALQWSTLLTAANLVPIAFYLLLLLGINPTSYWELERRIGYGDPMRFRITITAIVVMLLAIVYAGIFLANSRILLDIFKSRTSAGVAVLTTILCYRGVISGYLALLVACITASPNIGVMVAIFFMTNYAVQSGLSCRSILREDA